MSALIVCVIFAFATSTVWAIVLGKRWGYLLSVSAVILANFWLILVLLVLVAATQWALVPTILVGWSVLGAVGLTVLPIDRKWVASGFGVKTIFPWLSSLLGAVLWLGVLSASAFVRDAARVSWAMTGDAANNVLFARDIILQPGIALGGGANPVPLPSAVAALAMAFGRDGLSSADLLRHDVTAFAFVWALLIGVTSVMAGTAASAIARASDARPAVVAMTGATASLLPLSWFFTGYPIEFGFFNVHVALPIVFAAIFSYFGSRESPVVSLALLTFAATLLLASWSPLVLIPGALGLVVVLRHWRQVIAFRNGSHWLLAVGIFQLLAYGVLVVVPSLLVLGGALGAQGGVVAFHKWMLPAAASITVVLALVARKGKNSDALFGSLAVALGATVALAVLLATTLRGSSEWTYYPLKLAWLMTCILIVYSLGLLLPAATRIFGSRRIQLGLFGLVLVGTIGFTFVAPMTSVGQRRQPIYVRILAGNVVGIGDNVAQEIFALADTRKPRILWKSQNPHEDMINFWLLEMASESVKDGFALRTAAYNAFTMTHTSQLCSVLYLIGPGTQVLTSSPALSSEVTNECPSVGASIIKWP